MVTNVSLPARAQRLQDLLQANFDPSLLTVENESHQHGGPGTETHYKVTLVSAKFEGVRAVARHQRVYALMQEEMQQGLHALALHIYTPAEWARVGQAPDSPACRGGSKHG